MCIHAAVLTKKEQLWIIVEKADPPQRSDAGSSAWSYKLHTYFLRANIPELPTNRDQSHWREPDEKSNQEQRREILMRRKAENLWAAKCQEVHIKILLGSDLE